MTVDTYLITVRCDGTLPPVKYAGIHIQEQLCSRDTRKNELLVLM